MKQLLITIYILISTQLVYGVDFIGTKNISAMYNDEAIVIQLGAEPIGGLEYGLAIQGVLDDGLAEDHLKWERTLVGGYLEYPFLAVESLLKPLPIEGQGYAGFSLLWDTKTNTDLISIFEAGAKIKLKENLNTKLCYQYSKRDKLFEDEGRWLAGINIYF